MACALGESVHNEGYEEITKRIKADSKEEPKIPAS